MSKRPTKVKVLFQGAVSEEDETPPVYDALVEFTPEQIGQLKQHNLITKLGMPRFSKKHYDQCKSAVDGIESVYKLHMEQGAKDNKHTIFNAYMYLGAFGITFDTFRRSERRPSEATVLATLYLYLQDLRNREVCKEYILKQKDKKSRVSAGAEEGTKEEDKESLGEPPTSDPFDVLDNEGGPMSSVKRSLQDGFAKIKNQVLQVFRSKSYRRIETPLGSGVIFFDNSGDDNAHCSLLRSDPAVLDLQEMGSKPRSRRPVTNGDRETGEGEPLLQQNYFNSDPYGPMFL